MPPTERRSQQLSVSNEVTESVTPTLAVIVQRSLLPWLPVPSVTHVLSTVPPADGFDPVLVHHARTLTARMPSLRWVGHISTAAVYGMPEASPVGEDAALLPMSPYGRSKLMTEWMLRDVVEAHDMTFAALRYFNVAGGDPEGRVGQSTANATHLIKVACQTALGQRPYIEVFGDDYPTPDGTCIRDYIHVSDLVAAHTAALGYLRGGGESIVANCGYGHGFSVREVLGAVERVAGHGFDVREAPRRAGDPASVVANPARIKQALGWTPAYDDLDTIVSHAFAWEKRLAERNR